MEKKFSEAVLERIRKERIKPKPRWYFMLKDYAIWLAFVLSIILGALSFAAILYWTKSNDWDAYYRVSDSFLAFTAMTIPYFWVLCLLLFFFASYGIFKYTKTGYRYSFANVAALSLASFLVFGSVFYSVGAGKRMDDEVAKRSKIYNGLRTQQSYVWFRPERGTLVGRVREVYDDGSIFKLYDPYQTLWTVDASNASFTQGFNIKEGVMVKVFGQKLDDNFFKAREVRSLMGGKIPDSLSLS